MYAITTQRALVVTGERAVADSLAVSTVISCQHHLFLPGW
jgi:hypothetical protein